MKKKLFLHIGMHKTGTSAIQNFFGENRQHNLERYRLYYPETNRPPLAHEPRHNVLCAAVMQHIVRPVTIPNTPSPPQLIEQLAHEIEAAPADAALLSTEGLSSPIPELATAYAGFSAYFDVSVLVVLRRQDLFVESLHSQFVRKHRETCSLTEFMAKPQVRSRLDYRSMLENWASAFGRKSIHVLLYEHALLQRGIIESLFQEFSIPLQEKLSYPRTNVSPDREAIEVLRQINRCDQERGDARTPWLSRNKQLRRLMYRLQIVAGGPRILGRDARRHLMAAYQAGNAEIATRYLGRRDGRLFLDDLDQGDYPEETWTMPQDRLVHVLAQLTAHLCETAICPPGRPPGKGKNQ